MKFPALAALIALAFPVLAHAEDLTAFKTADDLWKHLLDINGEQMPENLSREESIATLRSWLIRQAGTAKAFVEQYPDDPRRWDVKMIAISTAKQLVDFGGPPLDGPSLQKEIDEVLAAKDSSPMARSEAKFLELSLLADKAKLDQPDTLAALQSALTAFLDNNVASKRAGEAMRMQMQILAIVQPANSDELLAHYAKSKNPEVSGFARMEIHKRDIIAQLRKNPITLKFFATNGKQVDFEKLRGKVVLLDFWASWCPPCMEEAPNITKTFNQLHDSGFDIVAISLDQEQDKMDGAIKQHAMTWPQHFDGKGYENEIAQTFGIYSIPTSYLFDKKGLLRAVTPRGPELAKQVSKLLAE